MEGVVPPGFDSPERCGQASLAERVKAWEQFGLSVMKAQLADGACVHEPESALWLRPLFPKGQTLCLVLHDDDNVVAGSRFDTRIHFNDTYRLFRAVGRL